MRRTRGVAAAATLGRDLVAGRAGRTAHGHAIRHWHATNGSRRAEELLEKHLAQSGLASTKVTWRQCPGGNPMNEGLLSSNLDIVSGGTTVFLTLWAKAKGRSSAVGGIAAVSSLPLNLLTRNPN